LVIFTRTLTLSAFLGCASLNGAAGEALSANDASEAAGRSITASCTARYTSAKTREDKAAASSLCDAALDAWDRHDGARKALARAIEARSAEVPRLQGELRKAAIGLEAAERMAKP
jgi:hypothetical protein